MADGTLLGRATRQGFKESFGWSYQGSLAMGNVPSNRGFLAHRDWGYKWRGEEVPGSRPFSSRAQLRAGNMVQAGRGSVVAGTEVGGKFATRATGRLGKAWSTTKAVARVGGSAAMAAIPLAFTGLMMYEGYQREGVWGAMKGAGESVAWTAGINLVGGILGGPATAIAMLGAATVGGAYMMGEAGRAHVKGLRQMEMGGTDQSMAAISSAGATTMRQRAASALNNTHLNGRMALGNEGFLMHRSFI
jgi:hypothetical protein